MKLSTEISQNIFALFKTRNGFALWCHPVKHFFVPVYVTLLSKSHNYEGYLQCYNEIECEMTFYNSHHLYNLIHSDKYAY